MSKHPVSFQNHEINFKIIAFAMVCFVLCLTIFLFLQGYIFHFSIATFILKFKQSLYYPHYNQIPFGTVNDVNIQYVFMCFVFSTILISGIILKVFSHFKPRKFNISFAPIMASIGIISLVFLAGVQQIRRTEHLTYKKKMFDDKTDAEKNKMIFGSKYEFARISQKFFLRSHQGKLLTDLDVGKSPSMFYHRVLSYYLYPKVSVRIKNNYPEDVLILFFKKNALESIPDNYQILFKSENNNYILAAKNSIQR